MNTEKNVALVRLITAKQLPAPEAEALILAPLLWPKSVRSVRKIGVDASGKASLELILNYPGYDEIAKEWGPLRLDLYYAIPVLMGVAFGGSLSINGRTALAHEDYVPTARIRKDPFNLTIASVIFDVGPGRRVTRGRSNPLDCRRLSLSEADPRPGNRGAYSPREDFILLAAKLYEDIAGLTPGFSAEAYVGAIRGWFGRADEHYSRFLLDPRNLAA